MTWSTTPTLPQRKTGAAWTTSTTPPGRAVGAGWFALVDNLAELRGSGALTANLASSYPYVAAAASGSGRLSATVTGHVKMAPAFGAAGQLFASMTKTQGIVAAFSGGGAVGVLVNDGLTAIIGGGDVKDGLSATVEPGSAPGHIDPDFTAAGALSAAIEQADGLVAGIYGVVTAPAGTGVWDVSNWDNFTWV